MPCFHKQMPETSEHREVAPEDPSKEEGTQTLRINQKETKKTPSSLSCGPPDKARATKTLKTFKTDFTDGRRLMRRSVELTHRPTPQAIRNT